MSTIFISYRRDDSAADMTDRIYERLVQRWGRRVFMDIDSLVGGDVFAKTIEDSLQNCAVVLVIIGRHWATLTDEHGARRIDSPGDYPRMEVAAALRRGIRVIPVLVGKAKLPEADELPADIGSLVGRQVVHVSRERFDADMRELIESVARDMPGIGWRAPGSRLLAAGAAVLTLVIGAAWYLADSGDATAPARATEAPALARTGEPAVIAASQPASPQAAAPSPPLAAPSVVEATVAVVQAEPPAAGPSKPRGDAGRGGGDRKLAAAAQPKTTPGPGKATSPVGPPSVSGVWDSTPITSAYARDDRFTLLLDIAQQDDKLLGTVTESPLDSNRAYSRPIVEGSIKGNVIAFHTKGEVTGGPNGTYLPYKEMYVGTLLPGHRQIEFRRYNDVSSGGQVERFSATLRP